MIKNFIKLYFFSIGFQMDVHAENLKAILLLRPAARIRRLTVRELTAAMILRTAISWKSAT